MRRRIIALMLSLSTSVHVGAVCAQESSLLGPALPPELVNPAEPSPAAPQEIVAPNPFRDFNAPTIPPTQPGFAEVTDQDLASPNPLQASPSTRQPLASPIPRSASTSTASSSRSNSNSFSPRLARAAPIMGDSLPPALTFVEMDDNFIPYHDTNIASFPTGGGATRRKVAENTAAFPQDRFIFNYNNFQNGIESFGESGNIDRFTLGTEKTFLDGLFSVDVRLPLSGSTDVDFIHPTQGRFLRDGSELGNVSVNLKVLLTSDEDSAWVGGLVVDTPTGGGVSSTLLGRQLKFGNEAVHLAPFLGFLCMQNADITHQAFLQVDVAANGNDFTYFNPGSNTFLATEFQEQTLLYVDYSFSKAFYRGNRGDAVRRVSLLTEFHYTTTLEDSDSVTLIDPGPEPFTLVSQGNRIDVVNLTAGIDTALSCGANLRVGTVVPLTDGDDRFFDIEFLAQVNIAL